MCQGNLICYVCYSYLSNSFIRYGIYHTQSLSTPHTNRHTPFTHLSQSAVSSGVRGMSAS